MMGATVRTVKFYPFDFAAALDSAEAIEIFLVSALETQDIEHIAAALKIVARSEGLAELAARAELPQAQISQALAAPNNLTSETTLAVLSIMGLNLPTPPQLGNAVVRHRE